MFAPHEGNAEPGTAAILIECSLTEKQIYHHYSSVSSSDDIGVDVTRIDGKSPEGHDRFWVTLFNFGDQPPISPASFFIRVHRRGIDDVPENIRPQPYDPLE